MIIVLSGAIANFSGLTTEQLLEYLKNKTEEFKYYKLHLKIYIYILGRAL